MDMESNEYQQFESAKKQVKEMKSFYMSLFWFVIVNAFLLFINLNYSPEHLWFFWPMLWWGIGLVFQGIKAFRFAAFFGKDWEERKIKEFMEKEQKQTTKFE